MENDFLFNNRDSSTQLLLSAGTCSAFPLKDPQYIYDPLEADREKINKILDHVLRNLLRNHNLISLADRLKEEHLIDLTEFYEAIATVNEYYDLRYYSPGNREISGSSIEVIDKIYFLLRQCIKPPLVTSLFVSPFGLTNNGQDFFQYAFHKNKSFTRP